MSTSPPSPQDFARLLQDRLIESGESRPLEFRADLFGFLPRGSGIDRLFPLDNYYRYYVAARNEAERQNLVRQFLRDWHGHWKVGGGQTGLPPIAAAGSPPQYYPPAPKATASSGGRVLMLILGAVGLLFVMMCVAPCVLGIVAQNFRPPQAGNFPRPAGMAWDFQAPADADVTEMLGGFGGGPKFYSHPDRSPVIGLSWSLDEWGGETALGSLQPLFHQDETPERDFRREPSIVWARPDYVLGSLSVDANQYVNAVKAKWVKSNGGKLDWTDTYESDWLGEPTGRPLRELGGEGKEVLGIASRQGLVVDSVGLILKRNAAVK